MIVMDINNELKYLEIWADDTVIIDKKKLILRLYKLAVQLAQIP